MFDRDGNGVIDFNEFASLWQYVCDWQETFRSFDLDGSGTIDRNELKLGTNMFILLWNLDVESLNVFQFSTTVPVCVWSIC